MYRGDEPSEGPPPGGLLLSGEPSRPCPPPQGRFCIPIADWPAYRPQTCERGFWQELAAGANEAGAASAQLQATCAAEMIFRASVERSTSVWAFGLKALRLLVHELVRYPVREPLRPGWLVTTGSLRESMPLLSGRFGRHGSDNRWYGRLPVLPTELGRRRSNWSRSRHPTGARGRRQSGHRRSWRCAYAEFDWLTRSLASSPNFKRD